MAITVDYFHRDIRDLLGLRVANIAFESRVLGRRFLPPFTQGPIRTFGPFYEGTYDAVIVDFRKRLSHRFALGASYTFADATDNSLGIESTASDSFIGIVPAVTEPSTGRTNANGSFTRANGTLVQQAGTFLNGPDRDKGPSDLSLNHVLQVNGLVELPYQILISGIFRAQSGFHFSRTPATGVLVDPDGDAAVNGIDVDAGRNAFTAPLLRQSRHAFHEALLDHEARQGRRAARILQRAQPPEPGRRRDGRTVWPSSRSARRYRSCPGGRDRSDSGSSSDEAHRRDRLRVRARRLAGMGAERHAIGARDPDEGRRVSERRHGRERLQRIGARGAERPAGRQQGLRHGEHRAGRAEHAADGVSSRIGDQAIHRDGHHDPAGARQAARRRPGLPVPGGMPGVVEAADHQAPAHAHLRHPELHKLPDFGKTAVLPATGAEMVGKLTDKPLEFAPGEKFAYSNSGYYLLGLIVERASGKRYADFLQEVIFAPLGMSHTGYDDPARLIPNRAAGYARQAGVTVNAAYMDMTLPFAAGRAVLDDGRSAAVGQALYTDKLVSQKSLDEMFTPKKGGYGYGWSIGQRFGRRAIGHGGGIYGFATHIDRFPADRVTVIVLSNFEGASASRMANDLAAIVFGAPYEIPGSERRSPSSRRRSNRTSDGTGLRRRRSTSPSPLEDGKLIALLAGRLKLALLAESVATFFSRDVSAQITFVKDAAGQVTGLTLRMDGSELSAQRVK